MSKNNVRIAIRDSTDSHNVAFFDNISGIRYQSANLQRFLAGSASILTIEYNSKDIDTVRTGCKLAFIYKERAYWLNIMDLSKKGYKVEITAYSLGLELNQEERGAHKPANAMSFAEYLAYYDPEHALELGVNEVADKRIKLEWTGTDTILARLFSIANSFDAELEFTVELNQDYSLKRQVLNVYKKGNLGSNRAASPIRVGRGLKVINYSDNLKELRTAVRATGKDGLTIDGLNKKVYDDDGNLLYYSSGMTVYAPQSRDKYPSVGKKSNDNWIIKELGETEYSTKEALWGYMLGELKKICVPEITYDIEGAVDGDVGDTRTLIDDVHYDPPLYVQARISELTEDLITGKVTKSTLTNFERKYSQIADSLLKQVEALAEDAAPYIVRLSTDNGYNFKNGQGTSTITARLEKYSKDIAATWKWVVDNKVVGTGDKLTVKAEQVTNTMAVTVIAYVNGNEVVRDYMTFSNSDDGVGVESIDRYFTSSDQSDGVTIEGAEWSDKPPAPTEDGKYLWAYDEITYTDGTVTTTKPAAVGANFDVDAFRAEIAEDLKDVPNREEFENKISEEIANSKAEIGTQIETAKTQAERNAKEYADTINQETAKVAELANAAADEIKVDLVNVKNNLTATSLVANNAQAAVDEAKQDLANVTSELNTAKQDLTSHAQQLQAQANAQTELTKRVTTVETTANGTKTTVSELSKTVDSNTKNITSVTARTKVVEDDLTSTKTTLTQVQTTADSASQKTATLETGLDGVKADLTATTATANTTKTNLANYQASNDRAVANLQSNLQAANGNISSLQTKIEAVPGQITSAVSAVEGKIPTSVGARNYIRNYGLTATGWISLKPAWKFEIISDSTAKSGQYLKATCTTASTGIGGFYKNLFDFSDGRFFGEQMTWSMDIKTSKNAKLNIGCEWGRAVSNVDVTENWQRFSKTFEVATSSNQKAWIFYSSNWEVGDIVYIRDVQLEDGSIATSPVPAIEDTESDINAVSSELKQTKDGMTLLATKTELNSAKTELQSGISTATSKADNAQATANSNTQRISTHTTQISALNTGLSAKVSQTDFNTLSGRVTTAENNITAKANELSSKITSVEGKIPTKIGGRNLWIQTTSEKGWILPNTQFQMSGYQSSVEKEWTSDYIEVTPNDNLILQGWVTVPANGESWRCWRFFNSDKTVLGGRVVPPASSTVGAQYFKNELKVPANAKYVRFSASFYLDGKFKVERGTVATDWSPAPEDYDSKLASAQSEFKQTTDAIKASVSSLDNSTVKSSSLTINADGIVMKAGKSTTDVANAIGSYFAVNQNAINIFSDKINVKGNMIVSGAITSDKIASKSINTAHLNGKIITADVISSNAVTADAIRAGAVTTDKMSANSINGDRITAGTLDAAKIKAGSITASQIASGTITSAQIKTGTISAANIAAGAITSDKIASNSIDASKIAANAITANMITGGRLRSTNGATVFDLNAGTLTFNNNYGYIQRVASDKIFEITTYLGKSLIDSRDYLTSAFNVRKSDNSRQSGIQFSLYNMLDNKPTATAKINSDSLTLYDSQNTKLFSVNGRSTYLGNFNIQGWGDIPVAQVYGGLIVKDIGIGGHIKPLLQVVEELCKKAGITWI